MPFFQFKDYQVHYEVDGNANKPVLLLLNGIMMSTKSWDPFVEAFTQTVQLLRVDMLDQGDSDTLKAGYTQAIQVEMLKALMDHLSLKKVHLAGISYGGSVALQFAKAHQDRLETLILFNAVAKTSPWLKAIGDGWNAAAKTRDGEAYYNTTIPFIYSPAFYTNHIDWMEARKEKLVPIFSTPAFLDRMVRLTKSAESHDVEAVLPNIKVATLIVASEYDFLTPPSEQIRIQKRMPNARLKTFNDCGHASMYEQPELFVTTIVGFMQASNHSYTI